MRSGFTPYFENNQISLSLLYEVHSCDSVFLKESYDGDELTLGRETSRIRVLVVYEHAVIQTPSCLGSLVNPRIAYIPSRFIAARTFFFLLAPSCSLPLSSFLPSPAALVSLSSGSSVQRILAARRHRQGSNVKNERDESDTKEKGLGSSPCVKTLGYLVLAAMRVRRLRST